VENKKSKAAIINPSILSDALVKNIFFAKLFDVTFVYLNSTKFNEIHVFDMLIIDNYDELSNKDHVNLFVSSIDENRTKIIYINQIYETYLNRIPIVNIENKWVVPKELTTLSASLYLRVIKRVFDIFFVIMLAPLSLFLILIGVILIKFTSKGPILFKQERVGKNGIPFCIYKLRTMVHSTLGHTVHTEYNDERVFPIGKLLRFSKIDELPQFFNVLIGQMSLIGPRPEKTEIVRELVLKNKYYNLRHLIKPGITGWAQVNNPIATPNQSFEKLEYDLYYIKHASLIMELQIVIKTVKIIINRNSL
jgi:lipopolysaccharide/colanic/teichoic acid biosynthesis glycosyltransferase